MEDTDEANAESKVIRSVTDLLRIIAEVQESTVNTTGEIEDLVNSQKVELWYRGQKDKNWTLEPGIRRRDTPENKDNELECLYQFRQIAAPKFNSLRLDKWGWITYAQHHKLPTRLLDWSTQPLIALYFACENEDEKQVANGLKDGLAEIDGALHILRPRQLNIKARLENTKITCLNRRGIPPLLIGENKDLDLFHPESEMDYIPPIAVRAPLLFERIIFQSGTFTIHPFGPPSKDTFEGCVDSIIVPADCKDRIRKELAILGISPYSIYRDLDRGSQDITERNYSDNSN